MSVRFGDSTLGAEINSASVNADFNASSVTVKIGTPSIGIKAGVQSNRIPAYTGPYEVTPSQSEQTLSTTGLKMTEDVVVNPIPSNYGLITWNGAILTVS